MERPAELSRSGTRERPLGEPNPVRGIMAWEWATAFWNSSPGRFCGGPR